ncbi:hypothetical protein ACQKWADRAFT_215845 [Trichoderma austrokoningii]
MCARGTGEYTRYLLSQAWLQRYLHAVRPDYLAPCSLTKTDQGGVSGGQYLCLFFSIQIQRANDHSGLPNPGSLSRGGLYRARIASTCGAARPVGCLARTNCLAGCLWLSLPLQLSALPTAPLAEEAQRETTTDSDRRPVFFQHPPPPFLPSSLFSPASFHRSLLTTATGSKISAPGSTGHSSFHKDRHPASLPATSVLLHVADRRCTSGASPFCVFLPPLETRRSHEVHFLLFTIVGFDRGSRPSHRWSRGASPACRACRFGRSLFLD